MQQHSSIQKEVKRRMRRPQTMRRKPRRLYRVFCRRWSTLLQEVRSVLYAVFSIISFHF